MSAPLLQRTKESLAVTFYVVTFLTLGPFSMFFLFYGLFATKYWPICLAYAVWWAWDLPTGSKGGRKGPWVTWCREWQIWRYFNSYFPALLVKTADLDPSKNYIICCHPHGILCFGAASCLGSEAASFSKLFPGIVPRLTTLEGNLWFPFFREFFMLVGTISSSRASLDYVLSLPKGQAPVVMVGGVPEMHNSHVDQIRLVIKGRKGFIKTALRHGTSLVPTFVFGETSLYRHGAITRTLESGISYLSSWLGICPVMFSGRGWTQSDFGILPIRRPLKVVVGAPLQVERIVEPSDKDISKLHKKYMEA